MNYLFTSNHIIYTKREDNFHSGKRRHGHIDIQNLATPESEYLECPRVWGQKGCGD